MSIDFDPAGAVLEDAPPATTPIVASGLKPIPFDAAGAVAEPASSNPPPVLHEDPTLKEKWAQSGPIDRLKMLANHFWPTFKKENPVLTDPSKLATMSAPTLGATAGQMIGAPLAEFGGVPIGGAIGGAGGDIVAQLRDIASGNQSGFKWGRFTGDVMAGMVPGASLAKAGTGQIVKQAVKYGASNLAAKTAETTIDEGRLPTLGEAAIAAGSGMASAPVSAIFDKGLNSTIVAAQAKKALYAIRDQTINDAKNAGYVIPGSIVNSKPGMRQGMVAAAIESSSGKAAIKQQASIVNQEVTNNLVKEDLGLPKDQPLTPQSIRQVRDEANGPYEQVAALSPKAADDLNKLNQVREDKEFLWARVKARTGGIAERDQAIQLDGEADKLESDLEQAAKDAGKPGLVAALREARTLKSKSYLAENALNAANGDIDASVYGRAFDKSKPLTGNAALIARMQQAFPDVMQASPKAPNISKLKNYASMALGAVGASHFGPAGAVAGAIPFSDAGARAAILSKIGQNSFLARPNYGVQLPDFASQLARFSTQNAGRNPPQFLNQFIPQSGQPNQ